MCTRYCTPCCEDEGTVIETWYNCASWFFFGHKFHLHILANLNDEDIHELRGRDLDHKDKQNYEAVEL
jgi:hypothetical protein